MSAAGVSVLDLLAKARWQAAKRVPYLARSLWAMKFIETGAVPTCAVDDKWRVYVNPDYIRECAKEGTLDGEVLHECLHPTLRHRQRAIAIRAENHRRWNACGDAELDQHIEHAGVKLVDKRVRPRDLGGTAGMSAEELYKIEGPDKRSRCDGGSGAGTVAHACEAKGSDVPGLSEAQADIVRAMVAHDIRKHAEHRGAGSVPAGLLRWAEQWATPAAVPWYELVGARVQYALDSRRGPTASYARPARRQGPAGLVLPVYRLPIPTIVLIIDTSGSMGEDEIGQAIAVAHDAAEVLGKVWTVACDAHATEPVEIRHIDDLREHLRGGGGTNLCAGFVNALQVGPDAIVVVTDGDTPWPDEDPGVPVTVVLTAEPPFAPPAWADVILAYDKEP